MQFLYIYFINPLNLLKLLPSSDALLRKQPNDVACVPFGDLEHFLTAIATVPIVCLIVFAIHGCMLFMTLLRLYISMSDQRLLGG
jgi:hypothetical protein